MKKVDYIIVGLGIAGITICEQLEARGRSYIVYDSGLNTATSVAGGVVNPVVLKRLNPAWNAERFFREARPFYSSLEEKLELDLISDVRILRIFNSIEEQNDWMIASDSPVLGSLLSSEIIRNGNSALRADLGLGEVKSSFRIDTDLMLDSYREYLDNMSILRKKVFDHEQLIFRDGFYEIDETHSKAILFSEGAALTGNPFFKLDCLIPKKGEYLIIHAPELQCDSILKGPYFMIPLRNDLYQVGATFAHGDFSFQATSEGKQKMVEAIRKMISCDFEVVDQITGMRPTVKDRRPILGTVDDNNIYFLNGLGTRGLLMAPLLSQCLLDHIETNKPLPKEVDIKRFRV